MARINKSTLTRLEIIRAGSQEFLNNGYTATSAKRICEKLNMSTGNLTFYFPTKEHLLAALVEICCDFQREMMEREAEEGYSSIMAVCLELAAMAVMCEEDEAVKDFYISAYTSPLCLEIIRKTDTERAMQVFRQHCPNWSKLQFTEAEILISGIEYATLMVTGDSAPLEKRVSGALHAMLGIYQLPEDLRIQKVQKLLAMDYRSIGCQMLQEFKQYVKEFNENSLINLLKSGTES